MVYLSQLIVCFRVWFFADPSKIFFPLWYLEIFGKSSKLSGFSNVAFFVAFPKGPGANSCKISNLENIESSDNFFNTEYGPTKGKKVSFFYQEGVLNLPFKCLLDQW